MKDRLTGHIAPISIKPLANSHTEQDLCSFGVHLNGEVSRTPAALSAVYRF